MHIVLNQRPLSLQPYPLKHFRSPYYIIEPLDKGTHGIIGKQGRRSEDRHT